MILTDNRIGNGEIFGGNGGVKNEENSSASKQ